MISQIVETDSTSDDVISKIWQLPDNAGQLLNLDSLGVSSITDGNISFNGSVSVGIEAAKDSDVVTLRQLNSAVANVGGGGASLTGVMNSFLGSVEWFNGTAASVPVGFLPANGQVLNRADYPDLWAAVESGMLISTDEDTWVNNDFAQRAKYSTGPTDTQFRIPDLNGNQLNSLQGLFLSGSDDGGTGKPARNVGMIYTQGAPDITGNITPAWSTQTTLFDTTTGAFTGVGQAVSQVANIGSIGGAVADTRTGNIDFNAANSDPTYGAHAGWLIPNVATGIWLIRVKGAFVSADTSFSVLNADETLPAAGSVVDGGDLRSVYQVNGSNFAVMAMRPRVIVGTDVNAEIRLEDNSGASLVTKSWTLPDNGGQLINLTSDGKIDLTVVLNDIIRTYGKIEWQTPDLTSTINFTMASDGSGIIVNYDGNVRLINFNGLQLLTGSILNSDDIQSYQGMIARTDAPASPQNGDFLNSSAVRSMLFNRGAFSDIRGGYFQFYHQEFVGNYAQGIFNLNGYGTDDNWFFRQGGGIFGSLGSVQFAASDRRLKENIQPVKEGSGDRIDAINVVEFEWWKTGEKDRGYIAQDMHEIDPCYINIGGENTDKDGNKFEVMGVKDRSVLADAIVCIQKLRKENSDLTDQLSKSQATQKSLIAALGYLADGDEDSFKDHLNELRDVHI